MSIIVIITTYSRFSPLSDSYYDFFSNYIHHQNNNNIMITTVAKIGVCVTVVFTIRVHMAHRLHKSAQLIIYIYIFIPVLPDI